MNADEFFASVDSTLSKKAAATVAAEDKAAANREHLKEVVGRLTPIANTYKAKLRERGVHVELTAHESAISFTLTFMMWDNAPDHGRLPH